MDSAAQEINTLIDRVKKASMPDRLAEIVLVRLNQLAKLTTSSTFLPEFDRMEKYIDWIAILPWNKQVQDTLDLEKAKKIDSIAEYLEGKQIQKVIYIPGKILNIVIN